MGKEESILKLLDRVELHLKAVKILSNPSLSIRECNDMICELERQYGVYPIDCKDYLDHSNEKQGK